MYGILQGYCLTIMNRATEFKHLWPAAALSLQKLAQWFEEATAEVGSDRAVSSSPSVVAAAEPSTNPAEQTSSVHPTVPVSSVLIPAHKARQKGRGQEKRTKAAFEKAAKKMKGLFASQM
jgi:hypothetical protein